MRVKIDKIIKQEIDSGILPQNIIISGHSQGASMALEIGLVSEHSLGGVIFMSGFLTLSQKELTELKQWKSRKTPILICHGEKDEIIPCWIAKKIAEILEIDEPLFYPDLSHSLESSEVFNDAVNFCKKVFLEEEINFDDEKSVN